MITSDPLQIPSGTDSQADLLNKNQSTKELRKTNQKKISRSPITAKSTLYQISPTMKKTNHDLGEK
jgi:hypothetical protein